MINTWSKFIYGTTIGSSNAFGDFEEGVTLFAAEVNPSGYTLAELLSAVRDAFNAVGGQTYTVTVNRTSGIVTISAPSNFKLLLSSGVNVASSFWSILGFSQGVDLTGTNTYSGAVPAGQTYYPQFLLQSYISPDDYQQAISPTVNRTMTGRTELVEFGVDTFIQLDIQFITNAKMDGVVIKNNPSGLAAVRAFMQDITKKSRFEFWADLNDSGTIYKCVLESSKSHKDGSGYMLNERYADGLPGVFDTGPMTLRVVS